MANERERQTSNKAGVKSLGKKLENSRHGFNEQPASRKTAGAFGHEERTRGVAHESATGTTHKGKLASLGRMKKPTLK
jgi:hypothetical protein